MKNHIASVHEGKKQHECNNCSATFDNLFDSEYHISSVHEGKKQHNFNRCIANFERLTLKIILHQSMKEKRLILKIRKVNNARKSLNFLVEKSSESSHEHAVK